MFYSGQRPAVNVGLSVSRVGGAAQRNLMKKSVGTIRLDLAQYREMQVFAQFSSDLDEQTMIPLKYGEGLMQLLKQPNQAPLSFWQQVVILNVAQAKKFLNIPAKKIPALKKELLEWFELEQKALCLKIDQTKDFSEELKKEILNAADSFFETHNS